MTVNLPIHHTSALYVPLNVSIMHRYGDESELAGFMGVLQAMISFGDDEGDPLRALITDELDIVFVQKVDTNL